MLASFHVGSLVVASKTVISILSVAGAVLALSNTAVAGTVTYFANGPVVVDTASSNDLVNVVSPSEFQFQATIPSDISVGTDIRNGASFYSARYEYPGTTGLLQGYDSSGNFVGDFVAGPLAVSMLNDFRISRTDLTSSPLLTSIGNSFGIFDLMGSNDQIYFDVFEIFFGVVNASGSDPVTGRTFPTDGVETVLQIYMTPDTFGGNDTTFSFSGAYQFAFIELIEWDPSARHPNPGLRDSTNEAFRFMATANVTTDIAPVPLPGSAWFLALGLAGLVIRKNIATRS